MNVQTGWIRQRFGGQRGLVATCMKLVATYMKLVAKDSLFGGNMCKASVNAGNAENVGGKSRYLVAICVESVETVATPDTLVARGVPSQSLAARRAVGGEV